MSFFLINWSANEGYFPLKGLWPHFCHCIYYWGEIIIFYHNGLFGGFCIRSGLSKLTSFVITDPVVPVLTCYSILIQASPHCCSHIYLGFLSHWLSLIWVLLCWLSNTKILVLTFWIPALRNLAFMTRDILCLEVLGAQFLCASRLSSSYFLCSQLVRWSWKSLPPLMKLWIPPRKHLIRSLVVMLWKRWYNPPPSYSWFWSRNPGFFCFSNKFLTNFLKSCCWHMYFIWYALPLLLFYPFLDHCSLISFIFGFDT